MDYARVKTPISATLAMLVGAMTSFAVACTGAGQSIPAAPTVAPASAQTCAMADGTPITSAFLPFTARWADAWALSGTTARIALSGPVADLQTIRRDVQFTQWPPCAQHAADLLMDGMNSEITGLLGFMAGVQAEDRRYFPTLSTNLTYSQAVAAFGEPQADAVFYADSYEAIVRGRESFAQFSTELSYAAGEQPRPAAN